MFMRQKLTLETTVPLKCIQMQPKSSYVDGSGGVCTFFCSRIGVNEFTINGGAQWFQHFFVASSSSRYKVMARFNDRTKAVIIMTRFCHRDSFHNLLKKQFDD